MAQNLYSANMVSAPPFKKGGPENFGLIYKGGSGSRIFEKGGLGRKGGLRL